MIDEIEDADDDIDDDKPYFIGSNKKKFNCNTFTKPLNFILAIYNGEISLKEAKFSQKNLQKKKKKKKIEDLKFNHKPKDEKEKK